MRSRYLPLLLLAVLPACSTDPEPPTPARVDVVSGADQDGAFNQALAQPLVVRVVDSKGRAVPSTTVLWTASGGTLSPPSSLTDASGQASTTWTLGPNVFSQAATATVTGLVPATFPARGRPGVIHSCETNTATLCADWKLSGTTYTADWTQGSHAVITLNYFGPDSVRFTRDDPSGTSTGMHAVYRGVPNGATVPNGIVTWTPQGSTFSFSGSWQASW
ncbi:MAG TPA: Ig-like domain-containing protein [Longimicrobiaceae bacterium]